MNKQGDIIKYLSIYDKVTRYGNKTASGYELGGIFVASDFDGYTVTITDYKVTLTIFFHNKYEFEYEDPRQLDAFINHLEKLDKRYGRAAS